jgi:glutathione S-transferase
MLHLLGKASSINVRKVLWTCAELQLPFERHDWGSGFRDTTTLDFTALNPNAKVPVINDDGFVLWESNTIIRYLANRASAEYLYPTEAKAKACVDQWMDWQVTDFNTAWSYAFMSLVRQSAAHQDPNALAWGCREWTRHMAILDRQLDATGAYVSGGTFSLADIPIGLSVNRWFETPLDHPDFPAVSAYYQCLSERPGFRLHGRNGTP